MRGITGAGRKWIDASYGIRAVGPIRLPGVLQASGVTEKGHVRPTNEDRFAIDPDLQLCVVADGMGGHQAGDIAAHMAVDAVLDVVRDRHRVGWPFGFAPEQSEAGNLVRTAIHIANVQILETAGSSTAYAGMGTTVVAALVVEGTLVVGHVGDSRLYRFSAGRLRQLTEDDSWFASALAADVHADQVALEHHPMRHALTGAVGVRSRTDVHVAEEPLESGDLLLLTTDGVHGVLGARRLERMLGGTAEVADLAADIVRTAMACGSRDNCTAVVARYVGQGGLGR
jgi:protein phosphatase